MYPSLTGCFMHYSAISTLESHFIDPGYNKEYRIKPFTMDIPDELIKLNGNFLAPLNRSGYYFDKAYPKKRIVVHYTAGQLRSDIQALSRDKYHVSVAFVIARDGRIYQLFSSRYWSGHIGKGIGNIQTGNAEDKATIGIELSNYGWLTRRGDNLETCYSRAISSNGKVSGQDVYCHISEKEAFQELKTPFRDKIYFASYTPKQYDSLIVLLRYLTKVYGIKREFPDESVRYKAFREVVSFNGIVTHVNYRESGKWDIGPAFDWDQVISGVKAESYENRFIPSPMIKMRGEEAYSEEPEDFFPSPAPEEEENDSYVETSRNPEEFIPDNF